MIFKTCTGHRQQAKLGLVLIGLQLRALFSISLRLYDIKEFSGNKSILSECDILILVHWAIHGTNIVFE